MKRILGLDLGTTSIGWALVNEAEHADEKSSIERLGVRIVPLSVDEQTNFEKGRPITTNADRTSKRSMRRNLQRYKLRRDNLIELLKEQGWINDNTILSEQGNFSTFATYRLRAKAATDAVSLEDLARVLLMINKKRGYKSSRKAVGGDEGQLIDGMEVAKILYDESLTPGQFGHRILSEGKRYIPEFYRSDLRAELDRIWSFQQPHHPDILTSEFRSQLDRQTKTGATKLFLAKYNIYTADVKGRGIERLKAVYALRHQALLAPLTSEELALVLSEVVGAMNGSSGYLGAISDRSKELYFNHQTIGQYLIARLDADPHKTLKNQPFYRQDYLDEFERIWETQAQYHPELTMELKHEIRDIVIFYQRRLKSQKWLVANCEFENRKVAPKSSPIFQRFKIWQMLNNITVKDSEGCRFLNEEERSILASHLYYKAKMSKKEVLQTLFVSTKGLDINFKEVEGDRTMARLLKACQSIIEMSGHGDYNFDTLSGNEAKHLVSDIFTGLGFNTDWLSFDSEAMGEDLDRQPLYRLWHLLYSFEGDNSPTGDEQLVARLMDMLSLPKEYAKVMASVRFEDDYGSLSVKAMQKILPFLEAGHEYSAACAMAGYKHSKASLTQEEIEHRQLKDHLSLLPRNSLRNPVVEKILNQLVNVVNAVIDQYGRPDEIRLEMARDLKKSAAERAEAVDAINKNTKEAEECRKFLQSHFGPQYGSRNDIIRYRLYKELEPNGYKTLYSNTYIPLEKLFSKEIDIEHIIPQARLFDDSFSNKTLEYRAVNIEKSDATAFDYVKGKYGDEGLKDYLQRVEEMFKKKAISKAKYTKLKMALADIPSDFIDRDLRNTQYISRKAQEMMLEVVRSVVPTTGTITDRLRQDWQLVNVMQELNWDKYNKLGLTEVVEGRDGQHTRRIVDWTKRNDHRHHAMDALTVAFTTRSIVQYLNNLNARSDKSSSIYAIEKTALERKDGHLVFKAPMEINEFRAEAKRHLEQVLISIKAKNKVVTRNTNTTQAKNGTRRKVQLTPRGSLHKETVYGKMKVPCTKEVAVGSKLTTDLISQVANAAQREALRMRIEAFGGDAKKAFTGKNSLEKNPIWLNAEHTDKVPDRVVIHYFDEVCTVRKPITKDLKLDKVVDEGIRRILKARLDQFGGDAAKAFSNLDDNPIWLNKKAGICIKSVKIAEGIEGEPIHYMKDKDGKFILDADGNKQPADYVNLRNNHHVAIFRDADGKLQEHIVSFYEATSRAMQHVPVIDKEFNKDLGWQFLFTMKQNEYFVFPNAESGFDPKDIDLTNEANYALISPNLFRVQTLSSGDYRFRHHLDTGTDSPKLLKDISWKRITSLLVLQCVVKVRVNHAGQIVAVGEY